MGRGYTGNPGETPPGASVTEPRTSHRAADADQRLIGLATWVVFGLAAWRLILLATSPLGLHGDEAQYWVWAQTPDWGYYSKPPLIAWLIWASTALLGDTPFGVRASVPLIHAATALILMSLGRAMGGARAGALAAVLFASLPGISVSALLMTTDVPLLFFYAAASLCLWHALETDRWRWWLGFGAALGLGILAKFAMGMLLVSLLASLLLLGKRQSISASRVLGALGLAVLIYANNLLWQWNADFASFRHVSQDAKVEGSGFNPLSALEFLGSQFGVFGPLLFAALLVLMARAIRDRRHWFLTLLILPQLLTMTAVALLGEANANWAAMVYAPAAVLVALWLADAGRFTRPVLIGSLALHLSLAVAIPAVEPVTRLTGIDLPGDPFRRLRGWDQMGEAIARIHATDPDAVILVEERMLFASLAFAIRPMPDLAMWNPNRRIDNHFEMTASIERFPGRRFLLVAWSPEPTGIIPHFQSWRHEGAVSVPTGGGRLRRYHLHWLEGYRGR